MITVKIFRENNRMKAFEVSGHANSGPYGYDLVCAGVSAVTFGAVNSISKICNVDLEIIQESSGYLHVTLPNSLENEQLDKAQLLFEGMLISLQTIERDYRKFIKIKDK